MSIIAITILYIILILVFRSLLLMERRITQLEQRFLYEMNKESKVADKKDVGAELVNALNKIKEDDANHLNFLEKARKAQKAPSSIYNQNSAADESFNTSGDLIPKNLTEKEKEILKLFYGNE